MEAHYTKYCPKIKFDSCPFSDCKHFEPCVGVEAFHNHISNECLTKSKQCATCDTDVYQMFKDEQFRNAVHGHICLRDMLL